MTSDEFKKYSEFKPKAIAGFIRYITSNKIAIRSGNTFTISDDVILSIRKIFNEGLAIGSKKADYFLALQVGPL